MVLTFSFELWGNSFRRLFRRGQSRPLRFLLCDPNIGFYLVFLRQCFLNSSLHAPACAKSPLPSKTTPSPTTGEGRIRPAGPISRFGRRSGGGADVPGGGSAAAGVFRQRRGWGVRTRERFFTVGQQRRCFGVHSRAADGPRARHSRVHIAALALPGEAGVERMIWIKSTQRRTVRSYFRGIELSKILQLSLPRLDQSLQCRLTDNENGIPFVVIRLWRKCEVAFRSRITIAVVVGRST